MRPETYSHIFGPVPSRRLGRSLGVDMVPYKTCSLDCIYCQVGATTAHTLRRAPYVPASAIIADITGWLQTGSTSDFITLAGSGEPTLNSDTGAVIACIKQRTDIPVCVLTNGTLFHRRSVRDECAPADLIVPSLDAADEETFRRANRPAPGLTLAMHIDGLVALRDEFAGEIWLEVMLVRGVNDSERSLVALRQAAERIRPDQIQVNTVTRPPATCPVDALQPGQLLRACEILGPDAVVIAPLDDEFAGIDGAGVTEEEVLAMLSRRPCTLGDVSAGLGVHRNEAAKYLTKLLADGAIESVLRDGEQYYMHRTAI